MYMAVQQDRVVAACEKHWEAHKNDCSGFVKAVAAELGVTITGMANQIVDDMQKSPWQVIASGKDASTKASSQLVIGGLKAAGHGHVVVVVNGPLAHGKYPTAYWGKLGGTGYKNTTLNWAWNKSDRDKVIYSCHTI
jgi:uncharacterized Zn-binding protein involved in type VI secretion